MHSAVNISFNKSSAFGEDDYHPLLVLKKLNPADLQVLLLCTHLLDNA